MNFMLWMLFWEDMSRNQTVHDWSAHFPHCDTLGEKLLFLFLGALVVGVVIFFYRREPNYVSARRKWILTGLRAAALLVMLTMLTGAYVDITTQEHSRGTVVLLFDTSQSMGVKDRRQGDELAPAAKILGLDPELDEKKINDTTRLDLVKIALNPKEGGLIRSLTTQYDIQAFTFGHTSKIDPLEIMDADNKGGPLAKLGTPDAPATQFGGALRAVGRTLKGRPLAAVIVFTDGASNRGEAPAKAAQDLRARIFPVGVGLTQTKDVEIPFIFAEDVVFKGDTFPIYVRVKQRGYAGQSAELKITADDGSGEETVDTRTIVFDERQELTVRFELKPETEGIYKYTASIEAPDDAEMSDKNNSKSKPAVRVIDKKIRVLYVEDGPRWEYRFLHAILVGDEKRLDPTFVLRQADPDLYKSRARRYRETFPETIEDLRPYNLIILGDIMSDFFTEGELKNLEDYVRKEGASLVILAGPHHMPNSFVDTPIEDMVPVKFSPVEPRDETRDTRFSRGFRAVLTEDGKRSPLLRFEADPGDNEAAWDKADRLYWYFEAERLKPAATALLEHETAETLGGKPMPLIAQQRYGQGQVLFFGIDETWRWRHEPGSEAHRRFWGRLVSIMSMAQMRGKSNRVQIETDRDEYGAGEVASIVARILNEDYDAAEEETFTAVVEVGDVGTKKVVLTRQKDKAGVYQSSDYRPRTEGNYRVTIEGLEEDAEHYFAVVPSRIETEDPAMQRELLKAVASAGNGGRFFELHQIDELAKLLDDEPIKMDKRREERTLWNAPGLIVLVAFLLGMEWLLRKRSDLL